MAALLAVVVLGLAGCGESGAGQGTSTAAGAGGSGEIADYDFAATTLDGDRFAGSSLEGRPAVLWFWAPWCPTCRAQFDGVSALAEKYDGEVAVVGVGGQDDAEAIRELAGTIPAVTHLVDEEGAVWQHFGVTEQSTYTVLDADGQVRSEGYLDDDALADLVAELVDGEPAAAG